MLTCNLSGAVARLYLEAKVLQIAALRLAQLEDPHYARKRPRLMRSDVDRLEQARDMLLTRYANPLTFTELTAAGTWLCGHRPA